VQPILSLFLTLAPLAPQDSSKKLEVVTTLGVLASLAQEVGGERVHVEALADPRQDPHFVEPKPTLMQKARAADVFIEIGLQLELWGEKVASGSGNPRIQQGQPGRVIASTGVQTLELPAVLSREWGDVHPYGNPHVWLDPLNAKIMAANIAAAFERVDAPHADAYKQNEERFERRIDEAMFGKALVDEIGGKQLARQARQGKLADYLAKAGLADKLGGWMKAAEPLRGRPVVTYHKSWIYFAERFGFTIPVEIEEKPGISPSARHRDQVLALIRDQKVKTILQEVFYERGAADYLAQETGAHAVVVPLDLGAQVAAQDYFGLIDLILNGLLEAETGSAGGASR
jgi:ABC-type Zn uptake system ZnuABC Zn-binding protein ZnuA